jgi:sec-independent protein translocase protein TatC
MLQIRTAVLTQPNFKKCLALQNLPSDGMQDKDFFTLLSSRGWQYRIRDNMDQHTTPDNFESQALTEHLRELRSCLIVTFIAVFAGFCISYGFIKPIGTWFFKPLTDVLPEGTSLIFTSYQEGFFFT